MTGITVTLSHLVPALKDTLERIKKEANKYCKEDKIQEYIDDKYHESLRDGVQTFMYQVNSQFTTQGRVWPF